MNSYELSRSFFNFSFENPEIIKPNHIALYFFIIEHCNRLGWKQKFGLPTTMAKEAIGIRSYNTYIKTLNDLVDWGFITLVERSKNQYSSNIIAISKNDKARNKALDKALIKHGSKQSESIDSIDKPETSKPETNNNKQIDFIFFWNEYDYKKKKHRCVMLWNKLSEDDQQAIMNYIPAYKITTQDKQYRSHPATFLFNRGWEDELTATKEVKKIIKTNEDDRALETLRRKFNQENVDSETSDS